MIRTRRMAGVGGLLAAVAIGPALWAAEAKPDIPAQQEKQKQVQAETDRLVRRLTTTLRVMAYYQLDKTEEKQLLDEVVTTLSGLSREQMTDVLARLDAATRAPDETKTQKELDAAYARHREIMTGLRGILAKYDAVKNLDQAAERLEKMAGVQLKLHLQNVQLTSDAESLTKLNNDPVRYQLRRQRLDPRGHVQVADEQADLEQDLANLVQRLAGLKDRLPAEQKDRWARIEADGHARRVVARLAAAVRGLRAGGPQTAPWKQAANLQRQAAGELQDLARALRAPADQLAAMREARRRIDQAIRTQEEVRQQTETPPALPKEGDEEKLYAELLQGRGQVPRLSERMKETMHKAAVGEQEARHVQELAHQEARLENDTRDTRGLLKPHADDLADKIAAAEKAMRQAEETLRKKEPKDALQPQKDAVDALRQVKKDLEERIAAAEKRQSDPLAALKNAKEMVEQLLKEQKDARDKTAEAEATRHPERLAPLTPKEQDLAKRTDAVAQQPLPAKPEAKAALDQAAKAMDKAAKSLKETKGSEAVAKQDEALKALAEAKKMLDEQVAEVEKRRDDIAALEDAAERLDKLAKKEGEVAKEAKEMAKPGTPPDTKSLSKKQGELTPQAKDLGKEVAKSAPEAAQHIDDSAKHMESAKKSLDDKQVPSAAKKAGDAAQKLKDAQKALAKALDQKKGMEAADQAAMKRNEFDPANAAQQVAKALEQTKAAAEQSDQAAKQAAQPKGDKQPNLAKLQKDVADKAGEMKLPKANKPAGEAAKALAKGDLAKAVEGQKKALEQLQKKAEAEGTKGEAMPKEPGEAKNAGQLAKAQEALLKATQAAAKSKAATEAAMAALGQAQAQAPPAVQPQLKQAGEKLAQAGQKLGEGAPAPANQAQGQAAEQLAKALQTLNAAADALASAQGEGQKEGQGQGEKPGQGEGQKQGQGQKPGEKQGQGQGQGQKPGKSQERNDAKGTGNRLADGKMSNSPSQLADVKGEGSFLHLPPRQREMIRQALTEKLPPEYAALIQQYYINLARGKPAAKPMSPDNR